MSKVKLIRPRLGFSKVRDAALLSRVTAIEGGLYGHPAYSVPPVDEASFKSAVADYAAGIAAGLDGGKTAIAERGRCREVLIAMLRLLGPYVESASNGDLPTFLSSGFEAAAPTIPGVPQPLPRPNIARVDHGNSGQLLVYIKAVSKARHYELRFASTTVEGPGAWVSILIGIARKAVPFDGLTPGTTYAFQVRAYNNVGYTDWSDSVTRMSM